MSGMRVLQQEEDGVCPKHSGVDARLTELERWRERLEETMDAKLDAIHSRITEVGKQVAGFAGARSERRDNNTLWFAIVGATLVAVQIAVTVIMTSKG